MVTTIERDDLIEATKTYIVELLQDEKESNLAINQIIDRSGVVDSVATAKEVQTLFERAIEAIEGDPF